MKTKLIVLGLLLSSFAVVNAQKFALIDMEYLLKHIPAYETANEQLNQVSKKWQSEIDNKQADIQNKYKNYQTEAVFLSADMKTKRENEIVTAEKELQELRRKYFGADGELFKKRESLIKPIQDEIYNAVKDVCDDKGYQLILDRASGTNIIFASPKIDISDDVLAKMGYSR